MTKHDATHNLVTMMQIFDEIRTISSSAYICELALNGYCLAKDTGDGLYPEVLVEINKKRQDFMA